MKPKTYQQMKDRFFENVQNMYNDDCPSNEFDIMTGENETMQWIAQSEGKNKDFEKWNQRCCVEVQAREDGL